MLPLVQFLLHMKAIEGFKSALEVLGWLFSKMLLHKWETTSLPFAFMITTLASTLQVGWGRWGDCYPVPAWAISRALWAAPGGATWYNKPLFSRVINKKPFTCSHGHISPQQCRSAVQVEQGDLFKFYACPSSSQPMLAHLWSSRTLITDALTTSWRASWCNSFHNTSCLQCTYSPDWLVLIGSPAAYLPTSKSTSSCSGSTNLHLVGKVPHFLGAEQWEHVQPCSMTASNQLPAATDELAFQHGDFHCHSDVHCRPPVVLLTFLSLHNNLHPSAFRCWILSATSKASTFHFCPPPTTSLRFNFEF